MTLNKCIGVECRLSKEKDKLTEVRCSRLFEEHNQDDYDIIYFCSLLKSRKIVWVDENK